MSRPAAASPQRSGTRRSDDLAQVAEAVRAWHDGVPLDEMRRTAPFVHPTGRCEVPDGDPAHLTESEWQHMRRRAGELESPWRESRQLLVETAYAERALRALCPFTGYRRHAVREVTECLIGS